MPRLPILLLALVAALPAAETVTLRADQYPPFNGTPGSDHPGSMVEIAQAVFTKAGYTVDYQIMPWAETIEATKAGRIDGAIAAEPLGVPDLAYPAEAQGFSQTVFATPASSTWEYASIDSLKGQRIGIIQDADYGKDDEGHGYNAWFTAHPERVTILGGDHPTQDALTMLKDKRLDVFLEDWSVITHAAQAGKIDLGTIRNAGPANIGYRIFIGFSPTDRGRQLAKILSDGTLALRADGTLAKILGRYQMNDWKKK